MASNITVNKKSSKKRKLSELEGFSVDRNYYNEVTRRLQNTNIDETVNLLNSGKYIDSDTLSKHKKRLSQYKSDLDFLNRTQKLMSNDYDESSYIESSKWLEDLTKVFDERESVFSEFKNEYEFNDAVKISELYNMPSADIEKQMGISKEAYESKLAPLEAEHNRLNNKIRLYNRGDRSKFASADAYNKARKRRDELKKQISNQKNKNDIAYTTSSGQNITWSSIYKKKKDEEDFNALYNEMSAMPDWAEQSQYKPTFDTSKGETVFDADDFEYERANVPNTSVNGFKDTRYVLQTNEKEKELFNYLAHTKGTDYALDWLMSREDVYKERQRNQNIEHAQKFAKEVPVISDAVAVMSSLVTPFEYLGNVVTGNIGERTMSADVASAIKGTRMEQIDWEVGEWDVFDFLYGTATSMAESALAMGTFGGLGGVSLGLNAAAQGTNDALDRGMSKGQAFVSGAASGIFEGLFESWSIGAFGDLSKNLKRADFRNLAKFVGKNMWNNAKEEFLTEVANIAYDAFVNGDFSQYETSIRQYMASGMSEAEAKTQVAKELGVQVAEAAGSGALMGFGFGVAEGGKVRHNIKQMGKQIKDAGETRNLVDLGKSLGEGTESYELANKITDKSKAFAIGQLYGIEAEDIANANKSDIVNTFIEKGFNPTEAKSIVNKMFEEGVDSVSNIRGMVTPTQVYNDVINNPNSTVSQREEAYRGILQGIAENQNQKAKSKKSKNTQADSKPATTSQGMLPLASDYVKKRTEQLAASGMPIEQATQIAQGEFAENQSKMPTRIEKAVESKFESNTEGKDFNSANDKVIASKKLVSSDKDNMKFEVTYEDGTTEEVDANNIDFGNDGEALVYSTVMDMNVPVGIAETLIGGYKGNDIKSAATYVNGMREAFTFGKYNQEADLNNGQYASLLTDEQRNNAFKLGRIYANEKAIADTKAIVGEFKPTNIKKRDGKVHFEGDKLSLKSVQDVSIENLKVLTMALGKDIHIFESYVDANGKRVYKDANGNIKKAPNGFYDQKDGSIWIDLNAGNSGEGTMMYTVAHELTHFIKQWSPTKFKALADFLVEQYGKEGVSVAELVREQQRKAKDHGRTISYDVAFEEMVADSMETMLTDGKVIRELAKKDKGLFDKIKSWIDNLLRRLNKEYKNYSPESVEGQTLREMKKTFEEAQRLFADALVDASDNFAIKGTDKAFVENYLKTKDVVYNLRAAESHQEKLAENYTSDASIDLETLQKRYAKVIGIWEKLGGELNSKFLNEWNNKVGKDRAFTIFKAQAGYKYNVELSSMCKKGVPLFEAIDTIVKKEVMNELKTKTLGKAEKEILYDILKNHNFEIPCAICYVEQARQREGVIINDFLDGKIEKNAKGKITKYKLGWNDVLNRVEKEMKKNGVDYTFRNVDKSIATDNYAPADIVMNEATQDAFYKALKKVANAEIVRWNREDRKSNQKERRQITDLKPQTIKEVFKGTLPSNLKIFKVLFNNPSSRFKISRDLLYSSATTLNLANTHNDLYSLFNSQGGVAGYKTKQAPIVYWGDILGKSWKPSTVRKEGGIRNQSNSDFQMYTLLDQAQMYIDFSAKGYYLQAYTKVLAELKLFGLSRGKINASLIPQVIEYKNADGSINWEKTMENAGLDENGNPIYDDFEGINHTEAFMLIEDAEYSKNICGICIGYSDNHIRKLLDDNRVQQIIGFHDKTDNPKKRYRGAKYAKNYNGLNEAVKIKADGTKETVHIGFNQFVSKAEKMFKFNKKTETFEGTVNHNGKEYSANDIPRLAADLYLEMCAEKNYRPAYNDFSSHKNYYKLLADFGLYDSQGNYAPHQKVQYNMPDQVPYLDKNGNKAYMSTEAYIKAELQKELTVRDSISEALADTSENGIIPQFVERVNALHSEADTTLLSDRDSKGNKLSKGQIEYFKDSKIRDSKGRLIPVYHGSKNAGFTKFAKSDDIGYFFARSIKTAQTYSGTKKIYAPNKNSAEFSGAANYNTYLNIKNPYIIDGNGLYWNNLESYGYDPVTVEIKSSHWNEDGSGKATLSLEYKGKTYKQTVHNSTEFENFLANHLNHEIAIAFAHAVDAKFDEKGKGHFATQIPWDFSSSKRGKSKNTRDIVRRAEGWNYDGVIFRNVIDSGDGSKIKADDLYVAFYPNQIKSVNNTEPTSNPDIRYSSRIEADMSEEERYEILKDKKIQPQEIEIDKDFDIEFSFLENNIKSVVEKTLVPKLRELGYLKKYKTTVVDVDFEFTGRGTSKSLHSQENYYGGNLGDFAKVVLNMQKLLDNSVLLEIHTDKGKGTPRENSRLVQTYVLLSAFRDGNAIKPVQFEVKQYIDNNNRLYLAVALTKIETGVKGNTAPQNEGRTYLLPVSTISLADLFKKVNIKDAKLLKYAPNQFLNEEQIKAKEKELEEDREKYSIKESIRVANTELASMDDTALYIKNTKKANYIGMIFNGTKTEETRSRRTLDAFIGKDFYVTDGEKVYGTIVLGEPHKYTEEEFHKLENQKKHRVPKGDEYDVKPGGSKWAYPIESYERFNKPKKLSDSKEYMNSFQARQVLYSEREFPNNAEEIAKNRFGTTNKWSETGWLLKDGTQLDFSGRHWQNYPEFEIDLDESFYYGKRNMEHYEIAEAFPEFRDATNMEHRGEILGKFLIRGNIRVVGKGSVDILTMPTDEQFEKLRKYFKENTGEVIVIGIDNDALQFEAGTNASIIVESIRDYFLKGKHHRSDLMRFHGDLFSDRDDTSVSTRSLLANALEGAVQNDIEKNKLAQYKEKIALIEAEQKKLHELREKMFTKGIKGDERRKIQEEATKTANRITTYDRQLFNLESTTALKNVLTREKEIARKRQKQRDVENLKAYKEKRDAEVDYLIKKNKKAIENRHKTVLKHKISDVLFKLDRLLNRGNKKRNIKQGLHQTVGSAINLGRMLFNSNIENEDIIRFGISALTEKEKVDVAQYQGLLAKKDEFYKELNELQSMNMDDVDLDRHDYIMLELDKINKQMRNLDKKLADVFERERARLNETEVTELVEKLAHDFAMLKESKDEYIKNSFDEYKHKRLLTLANALKGTTVKDMNKAQLQETYDAFKMIEHAVTTANQLFLEGQKADLNEWVENVQSEVKDVADVKKDRNAFADKILSELNKFTWENLRPVDAFARLGSKTFEKLFWNAIDGLSKAGRMVAEASDFIEAVRKKYGYSKWDLEVAPKTFITTDGKEFKPSIADMMSIYAYSFRDQAMPHMTKGGFTYDTGRTYKDKDAKGQTKVHKMSDPYVLSEADINNIVSTLSEEQRAYVKECLPYFQVLATEGNKVSMVLHGIEIFKDKAYFPLKSSYDYLNSTAEALNNTPTMASLQNIGMTKETTPGANNPIVLRGFDDVLSSHIEDMASYCSLALPITNLRKVFDNIGKTDEDKPTSTKALISSRFGVEAKEYFEQWIIDLNGGIKGKGASGVFDKLFSRSKGVSVAANMSVIVQQYFAIIRAMEIIDPKYFGAFSKEVSAKDMKEYEELCKYSGIAIIKEIGGYDVGAKGRVKDYINDRQAHKDVKHIAKKVNDFWMLGASAMDKLGWTTIWKAVKKEVAAEGGYTVGSEEFLEACAKRFNEVVTKTQVYDSVASRSGYMRSQKDSVKYATSFMGEPTVQVGRQFVRGIELVRAIERKDKSAIKQAGSMFVRVALTTSISQVLGKLAQSLIYGGRDDDDDEAFLEKWLSAFVENLHYDLKYLGLNNLPFARDVISIIDGWTVDRPDMTLIEDVVNAIRKGVTDGCTLDEAINLVGTMGNFFMFPVKNIVREFKSIANFIDDVFIDDIMPTNLKGAIAEGFSGDDYSKVEKLFSVYESGDTKRVKGTVDKWVQEKFDSYKAEEDSEVKAEKKAKQSVKSSFTATYRDEYKKAFKKKDANEMNRIRKFLYATGLWVSLRELDNLLTKWREEA